VAIFLQESDAPVSLDREAIAEAFKITRRELDVVTMLGEGSDLDRIAAHLDLSIGRCATM
jgi:hypothetical protein